MATLYQSDCTVLTICITYNQKEFINETLRGFTSQNTDFPYQCLILDDASTDGEQDAIREFLESCFDIQNAEYCETEDANIVTARHATNANCIFSVQFLKHNLYGSPKKREIIGEYKHHCKYVAYCEGDDYWTDPDKLQKQVDYLETHPDVTYSCHRFTRLFQSTGTTRPGKDKFFKKKWNKGRTEFEFGWKYPFRKAWITQTLTQVIRADAIDFAFLNQFAYSRDVHLVYSVLSKGKGVCHNFIGGVYRINDKGIYRGKSKEERRQISYDIYKELYEKTGEPLFGRLCRKNARRLYFQRLWVHR